MNSKEIARMACEAMEDKKAQDIKIIQIEQISTLADYFIIASGTNRSQVQAMADNVDEVLGGRAGRSQTDGRIPERKTDSYGLQRCRDSYF